MGRRTITIPSPSCPARVQRQIPLSLPDSLVDELFGSSHPTFENQPLERCICQLFPQAQAFSQSKSCASSVAFQLLTPSNDGVILKGGVQNRLEVVTRDYIPLPKYEVRRSEATPVSVRMLIIFKRSLDMTNATILLPNATPSRILYLHSLKFL